MANLKQAIEASEYTLAGAEYRLNEVIVGEADQGGGYLCEVVDSMGNRHFSQDNMTLDEIEQQFPGRTWLAIGENGEWFEV